MATPNVCLLVVLAALPAGPPGPNVVLLLADDQGWTGTSVLMDDRVPDSRSDFYRTPNLERLAREGMRFAQGYAPHPNCSPTRAAIQTGKSPAQLGMTDIIGRQSGPFYEGNPLVPPRHLDALPEGEITVAEFIKKHRPRYRTAHFGKWHLGGGGPRAHGYEEDDYRLAGRARRSGRAEDPKRAFSITERAVQFLKRCAAEQRPFFLQVSHHAVHLPIEARPETRRKYERLRPGKRHRHPGHAAMTEDLDTAVGILLDALDELGLTPSTYVFYTSDNGSYTHAGRKQVTTNLPLRGLKASLWEGGIRVPFVVRGPGVKPGAVSRVPVTGMDFFPTVRDLLGIEAALPEGIEGGSLKPLLFGEGLGEVVRPRSELVWHFPHYQHQKGVKPHSAIRAGKWKLLRFYETGKLELYDIERDLGERHDLSAEHKEKAEELERKLDAYLEEMRAPMPRPNPEYRRSPKKAAKR